MSGFSTPLLLKVEFNPLERKIREQRVRDGEGEVSYFGVIQGFL